MEEVRSEPGEDPSEDKQSCRGSTRLTHVRPAGRSELRMAERPRPERYKVRLHCLCSLFACFAALHTICIVHPLRWMREQRHFNNSNGLCVPSSCASNRTPNHTSNLVPLVPPPAHNVVRSIPNNVLEPNRFGSTGSKAFAGSCLWSEWSEAVFSEYSPKNCLTAYPP